MTTIRLLSVYVKGNLYKDIVKVSLLFLLLLFNFLFNMYIYKRDTEEEKRGEEGGCVENTEIGDVTKNPSKKYFFQFSKMGYFVRPFSAILFSLFSVLGRSFSFFSLFSLSPSFFVCEGMRAKKKKKKKHFCLIAVYFIYMHP